MTRPELGSFGGQYWDVGTEPAAVPTPLQACCTPPLSLPVAYQQLVLVECQLFHPLALELSTDLALPQHEWCDAADMPLAKTRSDFFGPNDHSEAR